MNFKTTLVLLALLAVVGGAVAFVLWKDPGQPTDPDTAAARDGKPVFAGDDAFDAEQVVSITLTRDGKAARFEREGDAWFQAQPVRFKLGSYGGPGPIAEAAAGLHYVERFEPGKAGKPTLKDVKLDPPTATVSVQLAAGSDSAAGVTHTFALSSRPIGGTGYALIDDQPQAYVVKDALHNAALGQRPEQWRDRSLPVPQATNVERLELTHNGGTVTLHRADGRWYIGDGADQRADTQAVNAVIDAVRAIYISDFVADAPASLAPFGLGTPTTTVAMTTPGVDGRPARTVTLRVGGAADLKEESLYANWTRAQGDAVAGGDVVFAIRASSAKALRPSADDLRDPRITTARTGDITGLRIERDGGEPIHLVQDGAKVAFADPKPAYAPDRAAWRDLLNQITGAQATGYRAGFATDAAPLATLTLHTATSSQPETIALYPADADDAVIALRGGESVGYVVPRADLDLAFAPRITLRDRTVLAMKTADLESIELRRGGEKFVFMPEPQGEGAWTLEGPDAIDPAAFEALRNQIMLMRAASWSVDESGFDGDLILTLAGKDGALTVLEADSGTGQAILTGVDAPFQLSDRTLDVLDAEFRDRLVLGLAIDQINRVTVKHGVVSLAVTRDTEGNYDAPGASLDEQAAAGLFDTLAGLRADRYRPVGAVKMDLANPGHTLTIAAEDGSHTLQLWPGSANDFNLPMGRLDGAPRTFDLDEQDYAALTATLTDAPAP